MAFNNNFLSESLINAAVASVVGCVSVGAGLETPAPAVVPIAGGVFPWLAINVVKSYHAAFVPSVAATGENVPKQYVQGLIQIDTSCLAPEFDYDFTNKRNDGKTYMRGNQPYERPYGAYRIALKVKDRYGNDNTWLGMAGKEAGEWPVSYHGTAKHNAQTIAEEGYRLSKGKRFRHGKGIYSTPEIVVAKDYASKFNHEGSSYKCILQNRVNPKYLKVFSKEETDVGIYWLSNDDQDVVDESELIRPYGICLFKE